MPPRLGGVGRENPEDGLIVPAFGEKCNVCYVKKWHKGE